jgi:hypothetical protein
VKGRQKTFRSEGYIAPNSRAISEYELERIWKEAAVADCFLLIGCLTYRLTIKLEAVRFSKLFFLTFIGLHGGTR